MVLPSFSLKKELDLKERTVQAMSNLATEVKAMHSLGNRLQTNVNDSLLVGMKSQDKETAAQHADEYDDLARLLDVVRSAEMLLHNLSVKADSVRYVQDFISILDSAMRSVYVIRSDISRIIPSVDSALANVGIAISEVKSTLYINEPELRDCELPATIPQYNVELPPAIRMRRSDISGINLTSFTTEVHTQI